MKQSWWIKIPIIVFFTAGFYLTVLYDQGHLSNFFLRKKVYPALQYLSSKLTDTKFHIRGPIRPKNKIIILDVDERAMSDLKYGRWPWRRNLIGEIIDRVMSYNVKVMALDMFFSEPDNRVPEDVKKKIQELLIKNGRMDDAQDLETDHKFDQYIYKNTKKLVLGSSWENPCIPKYNSKDTPCDAHEPTNWSLETGESDRKREINKKFALNENTLLTPEQTLGSPISFSRSVTDNLTEFQESATHMGHLNADLDTDGHIRQMSLVRLADRRIFGTLGLIAAMVGTEDPIAVELNSQGEVAAIRFKKSNRLIHVSPTGYLSINFRGPSITFPYLSVYDLMHSEDGVVPIRANTDLGLPFDCHTCQIQTTDGGKYYTVSLPELLQDAYVLLGTSAIGVFDMRSFPFDENSPGVEGHATILDNLITGDELISSSSTLAWKILFLLMSLGAFFFTYSLQKMESAAAFGIFFSSAIGFAIFDQKLFEHGYNWNTSLLYLEFLILFFLSVAAKYMTEEKNKKYIKNAFSKFVSPEVVNEITKDPNKLALGGTKKELTILFSDIRGFTTLSEKMSPTQLSAFLNEYLSQMTAIVVEKGTLDKYIGDAVMAFWGAPLDQPKHAANACRAAIRMMAELRKMRTSLHEKYNATIDIGIGLNTGHVSVGNMGSKQVLSYTVIGDDVNLASRLEGLTKYYGVNILTSRATFDAIERSGEPLPAHRVLDRVKVKGKTQPVEIIQILDEDLSELGLKAFEEARDLYERRQWDNARAGFEKANSLLKKTDQEIDGPCEVYLERCLLFKQSPPNADWDGSWEMTSK